MKETKFDSGKIKEFERRTGLRFRKKHLLRAALTHSSLRTARREKDPLGFERLEFLGDSILGLVISQHLFRLFPSQDEGFLSQFRSSLVSKKVLARMAQKLSLSRFLLRGGSRESFRQGREKILSDAFEALIAAVYFDGGLAKARTFLLKLFEPRMSPSYLKRAGRNPKGLLQEWVQQKHGILPSYQTAPGNGCVIVTVKAGRFGKVSAKGTNKKKAQEKAAGELLRVLKSGEKK